MKLKMKRLDGYQIFVWLVQYPAINSDVSFFTSENIVRRLIELGR